MIVAHRRATRIVTDAGFEGSDRTILYPTLVAADEATTAWRFSPALL